MELLKIKRQDKGITSVQMARYLGIRKETYSRKENGHKKFTNAEKILSWTIIRFFSILSICGTPVFTNGIFLVEILVNNNQPKFNCFG